MESKEAVRERVRRFRQNKKKGVSSPKSKGDGAGIGADTGNILLHGLLKKIEELEKRIALLEIARPVYTPQRKDDCISKSSIKDPDDLFRRVMAEKEKRFGHG